MRLLRRKNRKLNFHSGDEKRNVVFLNYSYKKNEKNNIFRKRNGFNISLKGRRINLIYLAVLILSALLIIFIINTLLKVDYYFGKYISPIPLKNQNGLILSDKEIKEELFKKNISYDSIDIRYDPIYTIILKDKAEVIVTNKKDIPTQIASLQFILNRLTMEGRKFRKLDLRFEKPVIVF